MNDNLLSYVLSTGCLAGGALCAIASGAAGFALIKEYWVCMRVNLPCVNVYHCYVICCFLFVLIIVFFLLSLDTRVRYLLLSFKIYPSNNLS